MDLTPRQWDKQSDTRERLAVLAAIGPRLDPQAASESPAARARGCTQDDVRV